MRFARDVSDFLIAAAWPSSLSAVQDADSMAPMKSCATSLLARHRLLTNV